MWQNNSYGSLVQETIKSKVGGDIGYGEYANNNYKRGFNKCP